MRHLRRDDAMPPGAVEEADDTSLLRKTHE